MELKVKGGSGSEPATVAVSEHFFGRPYNESLVHQIVTAHLANARYGSRAQKTRAMVRHSTHKPWRQKGTGRARAGMVSSPIWRGGGRAFPSSPDENFSKKVNRKMYRAAIATIFSQLLREDRLILIESIEVEVPKTKLFLQKLKQYELGEAPTLFVIEAANENVYYASRNIPTVQVLTLDHLDPVSLIKFKQVVLTCAACKALEERWNEKTH